MHLRRPKVEDTDRIVQIANRYRFPLPHKFREAAVVEEEDKIIAFGMLRFILEAIMVVDGSKKEIVEALKGLIQLGKTDTYNLGFDEFYAYAKDEEFAMILQKHFGFEEVPGKMLVLKVGEHGKSRSEQDESND